MRKLQTLFLCLSFILLSSFFGLFSGDKISEKRQIIGKINQKLSVKFKREYGLNFMGISEEAVDRKYKSIGFWFNSKKILSKDEGRILVLECTEEILLAINSYPGFDKYLINYPFTIDNISISIFIQPKGKDVSYPEIAIFSYIKNKLGYDKRSAKDPLKRVEKDFETYDEAKKIVEAQMNSQQYYDSY